MKISKLARRLRFKEQAPRVWIDIAHPESTETSSFEPKSAWHVDFKPKVTHNPKETPATPSLSQSETIDAAEPETVRDAFETFKRNQETA